MDDSPSSKFHRLFPSDTCSGNSRCFCNLLLRWRAHPHMLARTPLIPPLCYLLLQCLFPSDTCSGNSRCFCNLLLRWRAHPHMLARTPLIPPLCYLLLQFLTLDPPILFVSLYSRSMAAQPQATELSFAFEMLVLNRDLSLILPFFLGVADSIRRTDSQAPDQGNETRRTPLQRIIFLNPFAPQLMLAVGTSPFDAPFGDLGRKDGQPPASKASIEAMPSVDISEASECVISLEEMEVGGVAKEMPCNHKFHAHCIEKWLDLHGWCPVCRYKMAADEEDGNRKVDDEAREREIWVSFSLDSARISEDANRTSSADTQ